MVQLYSRDGNPSLGKIEDLLLPSEGIHSFMDMEIFFELYENQGIRTSRIFETSFG